MSFSGSRSEISALSARRRATARAAPFSGTVDLGFTNGRIYTGDPGLPWCQSLAIAGGKIIARDEVVRSIRRRASGSLKGKPKQRLGCARSPCILTSTGDEQKLKLRKAFAVTGVFALAVLAAASAAADERTPKEIQ
ncbi:hypothetical protein MUO32_20040 [Shinella sp. CPCC 101442]|uniref:hypothetical protein n=1 Tax=Shinella sp. CPCC 101442 TaxID=2932265 RepID=UPI0021536438|nr:hypothetical protein [Shinella sp. CPCC 101442]MCR6501329.1 hypothetical protein [Shinella sp. CPCC 101442]